MAKITKRSVDALEPQAGKDVFGWDSELRGFGIRVKPSGVKTFLIQYRNAEGRTRRLVLGQYGALAPEVARDLARKKLIAVAEGKDPSAERRAARVGIMVSEACDWYLEEAEAGRILGRNRRPIKASTLRPNRSAQWSRHFVRMAPYRQNENDGGYLELCAVCDAVVAGSAERNTGCAICGMTVVEPPYFNMMIRQGHTARAARRWRSG